MHKIAFLTIALFLVFSACKERNQNTDSHHNTLRLEEIVNLKLENFKKNGANDGWYFEVHAIAKAMELIRTGNQDFRKNTQQEHAWLKREVETKLNWSSQRFGIADSVKISTQISKILNSESKELALIEELALYTIFDQVIHNNFSHFREIEPIVIGTKKKMKVGETDTLKFIVGGFSQTIKETVLIGDPKALEDSAYRAKIEPIYSSNKYPGFPHTRYYLKAKTPGNYTLTGVICKFDNGKSKMLPFEYHYSIEK